jgi:hypothetical protein
MFCAPQDTVVFGMPAVCAHASLLPECLDAFYLESESMHYMPVPGEYDIKLKICEPFRWAPNIKC